VSGAPKLCLQLLTVRELLAGKAIANQLNAEHVPTLSGKGRWQKGTVGNLLAQEG
jgi:hypothetical protein